MKFPFRTHALPHAASTSTEISRRPGKRLRGRFPRALNSADEPHLPAPRLRFAALWRLNLGAHRRDLAALLVALLIALALSPHLLNFARRDEFERAVVPGALGWRVLEATEGRLLDQRFVSRGALAPRSVGDIAIVAIDQSSLDVLREWPWPREWHAQLIRRLKQAGARVIVFDVSFGYKQGSAAKGGLSLGDTALVASSEAAGNVLFSAGFHAQSKSTDQGRRGRLNSLTTPFDELDETTADVGFNWLPTDSFGQTRRYAWRANVAGASLASLAALSVAMFQGKLDGNENKRFFQVLEAGSWPDASGKPRRVPLSEVRVGNHDRAWTTPIFFWGPQGTIPTYSYSDVLRSREGAWSPAELKRKFGGRIVFVGATAALLKDTVGAPSFQTNEAITEQEAREAQIAGVEIHAGIAAQMLDGRYLQPQSSSSTWAALFVMCLGSALWMSLLRAQVSRAARRAQGAWSRMRAPGRIHSLVWFSLYAVGGSLPIVAFWSWAQWELAQRSVWIVAIYPLLGASLSAGSALLLFFVAESGDRRKVMARFGRQVSPDVLEEQLAHPEEIEPRPQRAQVTVLFSDLEGFTSFSEAHSAEEVGSALDEYMTRMVEVVHGHGGTIDKFIGDAVMAFFGAPVARYDHAAQALACAVSMQEECGRFRRETGIEFYMRVGVHSGEVIVGMMGARARANYTVIGDTVNLASRLEAKNKELGSRILCSDSTFSLAPEVIEAEPAQVPIKGLTRQVDVWIVRGLKGLLPSEQWDSLPPVPTPPDALEEQQHEAPHILQEPEPPRALPALAVRDEPGLARDEPEEDAST